MMKKIILLPVMLLLVVVSVMAYDVNDTIRINAEYRESGVLTESTANISVSLPNGLEDVYTAMINDSIGLFHYDYVIADYDGEYTVRIDYYKSDVYTANETQTFNVGDVNELKWNVCPTGTQGWVGMWILLIILIVLAMFGYASRNPILTAASGIFMMLTSFFTFGCGEILGYASVFFGLIFILIAASIKT